MNSSEMQVKGASVYVVQSQMLTDKKQDIT